MSQQSFLGSPLCSVKGSEHAENTEPDKTTSKAAKEEKDETIKQDSSITTAKLLESEGTSKNEYPTIGMALTRDDFSSSSFATRATRKIGSFSKIDDYSLKIAQRNEEDTKTQDTSDKEGSELLLPSDSLEVTESIPDTLQSGNTATGAKKRRGNNPRTIITQQRATIAELRARLKILENESTKGEDDREMRGLKIQEATVRVRIAEEILAKAKLETEEARIRTNAAIKLADLEMARAFKNNKF